MGPSGRRIPLAAAVARIGASATKNHAPVTRDPSFVDLARALLLRANRVIE
jgi:hypothetical protein